MQGDEVRRRSAPCIILPAGATRGYGVRAPGKRRLDYWRDLSFLRKGALRFNAWCVVSMPRTDGSHKGCPVPRCRRVAGSAEMPEWNGAEDTGFLTGFK